MNYPHGGAIQIWRDNEGGSPHDPIKSEIRDLLGAYEEQLVSQLRYRTRAEFVGDAAAGEFNSTPNDSIIVAENLAYKRDSAATAISDLAGWIPFGTVTPFHWGAVEEPEGTYSGTDQSAKIQAFMDFINANPLHDVNWTGAFSVASGITLGVTSQVQTMYCRGRLFLRGMNDIAGSVFKVDNLRPDSVWGDVKVNCFGGADYAIRNTPVAIELGAVSRAKLGSWQGAYAQIWGVWCTTNPGVKNSNLLIADKLSGLICGSGYDYAGRSLTGSIGSKIDYGTAGSTSQATRISVASAGDMPPSDLAGYGIEGTTDPYTANFTQNDINPVFVEIAGRLHHVTHVDRAGFAVWVYPRVAAGVSNGTEFRWIFGGGVGFLGGDSNVAEIGVLEASNCGIGASFGMLYGPKVGMMLCDAVGIAAHFGGNLGNANFGTCVDSFYIEGADRHIVTSSINTDFEIANTFALDVSKIETTVNPSDAAGVDTALYPPIQKGRVSSAGLKLQKQKRSKNAIGSTVEFVLDRANRHDIHKADTVTVNMSICSVPDDHIDPRRLALFMARSLLREIRDGGTDACSTA